MVFWIQAHQRCMQLQTPVSTIAPENRHPSTAPKTIPVAPASASHEACLLAASRDLPSPPPFRPTHHCHHSLFHHRGYFQARERLVDRHFYVDVVRVVIILDVVFFFLFSTVLVLRLLSIDWFPRTMGHGGAPGPSLNWGEDWCRVAQWAKVAATSGKCGESLQFYKHFI